MHIIKIFAVASAAFFIAGSASAQNTGTVTNNAFAIGKGPGQAGFTSLLCGTAQLAVGQNAAAPICRTISGDVTIDASGATSIGAGKVTNSMLVGTITAALGGTGQSTYALGDILYASSGSALSKLAGNTTTSRRFLRQTGTGSVSAAPAWDGLTSADMPAFTGDVSTSAGATTTTLATVNSNVGSFGSGSAVPSFTVDAKGRITAASSQAYQDATAAVKGVVRVDGTTITASGGVITAVGSAASSIAVGTTTITGGSSGQALFNNAGVLGARTVTPTVQKFTSGSGTYTTPAGALWIKVTMVGGGGGGNGGGTSTSGGTGGTGGNTTFGTNIAAGGVGGSTNTGGVGGAPTLSIGSGTAVAGGSGTGGGQTPGTTGSYFSGAAGGNSILGGAGGGGGAASAGFAAAANTGSGGGGGNSSAGGANVNHGSGGGAGAGIVAIITSPSATYSYAVGALGAGAAAGTGGTAGGNGAAGVIVVEEFYN